MQSKSSRGGVKYALEDQQLVAPQPTCYGWPRFDRALALDRASCSGQTQDAASHVSERNGLSVDNEGLKNPVVTRAAEN